MVESVRVSEEEDVEDDQRLGNDRLAKKGYVLGISARERAG